MSDYNDIKADILRYYACLLGSTVLYSSDISQTLQSLVTTKLHEDNYSNLIADVTLEEKQLVVKGMPNNKITSPG